MPNQRVRGVCSLPNCERPHQAKGQCQMHYSQHRRSQEFTKSSVTSSSERFWSYVTQGDPTDCWIWSKSLNKKGYGRFQDGKTLKGVHRFAYQDKVGPIPLGSQIDHKCRRRSCVNPKHLQIATGKLNSENVATVGRKGASQYRGVDWHARSGKWRARVHNDGVVHYLGHFSSELDAANAALAKRLELHTNNLQDRELRELK